MKVAVPSTFKQLHSSSSRYVQSKFKKRQKLKPVSMYCLLFSSIFFFGLDGGFQEFKHSTDLFEEIRRSSHGASVPEILLPLKSVNFIIWQTKQNYNWKSNRQDHNVVGPLGTDSLNRGSPSSDWLLSFFDQTTLMSLGVLNTYWKQEVISQEILVWKPDDHLPFGGLSFLPFSAHHPTGWMYGQSSWHQ